MKYWTKCGREFARATKAATTGYALAEDGGVIANEQCRGCPFVVDIKDGWPNATHKRYECKAGSYEPNHETTYAGLDGKTVLHIRSLDFGLLETIREYAIAHPNLGAQYNNIDDPDCRKVLAVSCDQNKSGELAKRDLVHKFLGESAEQKQRSRCPHLNGIGTQTIYCARDNDPCGCVSFTGRDEFQARRDGYCLGRYWDCERFRGKT